MNNISLWHIFLTNWNWVWILIVLAIVSPDKSNR